MLPSRQWGRPPGLAGPASPGVALFSTPHLGTLRQARRSLQVCRVRRGPLPGTKAWGAVGSAARVLQNRSATRGGDATLTRADAPDRLERRARKLDRRPASAGPLTPNCAWRYGDTRLVWPWVGAGVRRRPPALTRRRALSRAD